MLRLIPIILFCLLSLTSAAQEAKDFSFTHYTTLTGLVSNQVNAVLQDDEGYLWIGTTDGLQRFDGIRYKTFRYNNRGPASMPSSPVWKLLMDAKKNLWVLMSDGRVGIFDTKKLMFRIMKVKVKSSNSIQSDEKKLIADSYGNVFLLLRRRELLVWNEERNEFSSTDDFFQKKINWAIEDIVQQPGTKKYWIGKPGGGIAVYNAATGNLSYAGNNIEKEIFIEKFPNLSTPFGFYFDSHHRFWLMEWAASFAQVHCYDMIRNETVLDKYNFIPLVQGYYETHAFFEQADGTIWIRGNNLFARYVENENRFQLVYNGYHNERSIAFETITSLFEDREKNIWVGSSNNGLYRFNPANEFFTNVTHLHRRTGKMGLGSPMSFMYTKWGTILSGTWGDGLFQYDKSLNNIPLNIKGLDEKNEFSMWGMCASKDSNTIWMGNQPGLWRIDQDKRSAKSYNTSLIKDRTVRQVAEDKKGNLWLGSNANGVVKWVAAKGKIKFDDGFEKYTAIPDVQVAKITIDSKGYIWVATASEGAYVIDPGTDNILMHFSEKATNEKRLPEAGVSSILEYNDSIMILGTATRMIAYNRILNRSAYVGMPGMMSGFIAAMEKDKNGYVWVTTTNGLYRVNIQKRIFVNFNRADGIDNEQFIVAASYVLPDGRMLFGTNNQFLAFDPYNIRINAPLPQVKVTDFEVMNKSLPVDSLLQEKVIELGYQENSLVIEFSALRYNSAYLIKYRLEPLDKEWKIADKNSQAIYSYLPPGTYKFMAKTMDEEGKESTEVTQLVIKISSPFWKTWWFYSLAVLVIGSLLFYIDRERMNRKEAILQMRGNIAGKLHEEVNTALGNINILSEMARKKADTEPQKSKEFIEQIHNKSGQMIYAMEDMLWNISPDNDSMSKALDRIKEHIEVLKNRYATGIDLQIDKKTEGLKLNMQLRQNIFWLLKSGVTNITRSGATDLRVHIGYTKPNLIYTVEFDNSNMDMQQMNNLLQRQELSKKLKEINAVIDVQMRKAKSVIELTIPV